ncbi:T6SS effector amidase Tae4 family protein [Halioxenophilus aromaticivorans]|uniref:Type VI secretion system amidase effector protein Tae4 n=1 Tax=Halioxenophilus aromaticivorans TaxID=1306992 RepID=A0AAV3U9I9_9ALTE
MRPTYQTLKSNYYSSNELAANFVDGETLYSEIGYDQNKLIEQNSGYVNTCATRVSLALLKSGVRFQGRLKIKQGAYEGYKVEPGAKLLADQLMDNPKFGRPEIYKPNEFVEKVKNRKGIVLFWKIAGYGGGHIDLIEVHNAVSVCNSNCYFQSKEIWFWELK